MKTRYKYIHFAQNGAKQWTCYNTRWGSVLGFLEWFGGWKQFVFRPIGDGVDFSADCLDDISYFMKQLNEAKP